MPETMLNMENGSPAPLVERGSDPVLNPVYASPADYAAQYPTPLDPSEVIAMCDEINLLSAIPEIRTPLKAHTWREMTSLAFTSGSTYVAFQDGYCPEEYTHNGSNTTVDIKNIGAKKSLSYRDILHSQAIAAAGWNGINTLVGPGAASSGVPGGNDVASLQREAVRDVKEKEIKLAMALVMNGEDRLLVSGNHGGNALEFTGIENWASAYSCTMHTNSNTASGTFSAAEFDRFLGEGCAKPTHIFGHPQAVQEMMSTYFQLGFAGSQSIVFGGGNRLTPGYNFGSVVNTGVGPLTVVSDSHFTKTNIGSSTAFQAKLWALRLVHNGEPLVYRATQIPLAYTDLAPGCTAISFEVWKATALIIKACCAQSAYTSQFTGRYTVTNCTSIG